MGTILGSIYDCLEFGLLLAPFAFSRKKGKLPYSRPRTQVNGQFGYGPGPAAAAATDTVNTNVVHSFNKMFVRLQINGSRKIIKMMATKALSWLPAYIKMVT